VSTASLGGFSFREDGGRLGVLLTIVAIAISGSAGVAAERRWPDVAVGWARRALVISLYTLLPFVVFFNLARTHINTDEAGGLVIGWVALRPRPVSPGSSAPGSCGWSVPPPAR